MESIFGAGLLSKILKVLGRLGTSLLNTLEDLAKEGYKVVDVESNEDSQGTKPDGTKEPKSYVLRIQVGEDDSGNFMLCKMTELDADKNLYKAQFVDEKTQVKNEYDSINQNELSRAITETALKFFDFDGIETITQEGSDMDITKNVMTPAAASRLIVKLNKVVGSEDISVELSGVYANYDAQQAFDDLTQVVNDDDFVAELLEEPQTFAIVPAEDDSLSVELCDECDEYEQHALTDILQHLYKLLFDAQAVHWNVKGETATDLHMRAESCYYDASNQIDQVAELTAELCGSVQHPMAYTNLTEILDTCSGFDMTSGITILRDDIDCLVNTLQLYSCNFDSDIQSMMDDWIRGWRKQSDYFMKNILR